MNPLPVRGWLAALALVVPLAALAQSGGSYPSATAPWTDRDYVNFYFAHHNGRRALPHLRQPGLRAVFERLVDSANIAAIRAADSGGMTWRLRLDTVLASMGSIRASYFYAVRVGEPLAEELTRIQIFTLELLEAILTAPGEPDLSLTHPAWRTAFLGVATSLSERDIYSDAQALRLAEALARHFAAIEPTLWPADAAELAAYFGALGSAETNPALRAALARLAKLAQPEGGD